MNSDLLLSRLAEPRIAISSSSLQGTNFDYLPDPYMLKPFSQFVSLLFFFQSLRK